MAAIIAGLFLSPALLQGCEMVGANDPSETPIDASSPTAAPTSDTHPKLRHPQLLDHAHGVRAGGAGKMEGESVGLILGLNVYEADGITPRVLNRYGITSRLLNRYGDLIRIKVSVDTITDALTVSIDGSIYDDFMSDMETDEDIAWVEPDFVISTSELGTTSGSRYDKQITPWGIGRVAALTGETFFESFKMDYLVDQPVSVYILDSGVLSAPFINDLFVVEQKDFTMLFENRDELYWDDTQAITNTGFDPGSSGNPLDESGHGTHIAGIVGAINNFHGVVGVAPMARIHNLKVLTAKGQTDVTTMLAAVEYVTRAKLASPATPMVVNISLGMDIGTTAYNVLDEAIAASIRAGIVYVVSAGNSGKNVSTFSPAHVKEAITVGSYNVYNQFSPFSNHGAGVDLLAPGEEIVSLTHRLDEIYAYESILASGTSFAAPHVTGAVVRYLGSNPAAKPSAIESYLKKNAKSFVSGQPLNTTNKSVSLEKLLGTTGTKPPASGSTTETARRTSTKSRK